MGQMEMKWIFNFGKNISIWANVTQVSDVAHGPLVVFKFVASLISKCYLKYTRKSI
jgi:hypothetical protein